jgi:hypothetical protein
VLLRNLQELWDTAIHSAQENRIDNDRKSKQVFNKVATLQAHHHQMPKDRCTPDGFPKMNPMRRQLLISLLLLFLVARSAMAQTFPVQASTNIVPPYSTLLADYVAPGSQRLALNIFLADLNRPQLQTRLRLRIEGEGISITTRPSFMPPPLILQGGIPERLSGTDLAEYFLPQNLDFTGITRRQFESTGKLPEGLYRFCFEILEYNRGVKVSNAACTMAWLILNDPPLINWPDQGEKLTPQDPQYITFQWTPRHTGSPNSAFTTEYDFALVELWPANRNPNDAILTTPPIFETTTQSTTLIYGPEATPLVPGRSYAFRVRARAIIGTESYDLFKNQGYSEAIGFVYGDACTLPTNINARATSGERFNISWEPATVHTNFNVRYRPAIRTADQWYEETTFLQNLDIGGLMAQTTYEYQVAAGCGPFLSEYSDIASVTTESRPPVNYTCGLPPEEYSFENREPLPQLNVDDVVLVGDFEVRMMEVSGSNGNFSGKGRALVPYLDNMLVVVEFDQVSVNTDYRMTGGQMDVKGFGADILPDGVNDFLDELDESLDAIENTLDDIATGLDVADSIANQVQDLANDILDDGPLTIEDEERLDAATVAMYLEGAQQAAEAAAGALAAALTPESIETAAREVARAMELTKRGKRLRQIHDNADTLDAIAVEFFASENYGFDISRYRQHRLHYNIMVTADDETHRIPWVATAAGQQETVSARLTGNTGTDAADVAFESDGTALQATMTGDTWSITLPAMEAGAQRSIVALSSTTGAILGRLDAIAYEPIGRKVNLVPVGSTPAGLNAGDILTALNNTYRQAVASWEVAVLDPLTVDGYTGTLQDDEQALLSVYSTGMREIIRAFEASGAVNEDEFYLFLVDRSQVGNTGYMPRKHRYGFIYMEDNPDVPRTVAHELGHGAFRLQHTFEEYPTIGGPRSTANLMDYGTGTKLRKYQWDLIHNPPLVVGLLEDEGEGAWKFTIINDAYTDLFNYMYENYMENSKLEITDMSGYDGEGDFKSWKLKADGVNATRILEQIRNTATNSQIPDFNLIEQQIASSTVSFNNKTIPIIVYSPIGKVSGIAKKWYTDVDAFNNSKFYYCEERVADDYIVLSLYAKEADYPLSPALILQMEDREFNLKEKWLRELLILEPKKPDATPLDDADLKLLFPSLTDAEQEELDDRKNYWAYVSTNMSTLYADCKGKDVTLDFYDNKKISAASHRNVGKQMITGFRKGANEFKYYNKVYINTDFEAGGAKYDIAAHNFGGTKTYNAANRPTIKNLEDLSNVKLVKSVVTPNFILIAFYESEGADPFIVYQVNGTDGGIKETWLNYFNIVENEEKVKDLIETIVDAQDEDYKGIVDLEKKLTNESVFARDFEIEDKKFDVYIERSGKVEDDKSKVYLFTSEEKTKILGFDGEFTSFTLTNNSGGITTLSVPTTQAKDFVAFVLKPELGHAANIRAICERIQQAGVNQKKDVSFETFDAIDPKTWWTPMPNIKLGGTVFDFRSYQIYYREDKNIVLANIEEYIANDPEKYGKAITFKNKENEDVVRLHVKKEQFDELKEYLFTTELVIKMVLTLIDENELNTLSSFSIDNGKVTGYIIERDGIPANLERIANKKKRVPENTYEVVRNDCKKFYIDKGKQPRDNCAIEFRLVTTPEKSGTRSGILIHAGVDYKHSTGCLLTASSYASTDKTVEQNDELKTIKVYNTNGTSLSTLKAINDYFTAKEKIASEQEKKIKMMLEINR